MQDQPRVLLCGVLRMIFTSPLGNHLTSNTSPTWPFSFSGFALG